MIVALVRSAGCYIELRQPKMGQDVVVIQIRCLVEGAEGFLGMIGAQQALSQTRREQGLLLRLPGIAGQKLLIGNGSFQIFSLVFQTLRTLNLPAAGTPRQYCEKEKEDAY